MKWRSLKLGFRQKLERRAKAESAAWSDPPLNNDSGKLLRATRGKETPMFPFDAILFDVGGVLLTNGWDHRERAAAVEHFALDAEDLETRHLAIFAAWERDAIGLDAYLDQVIFYKPRPFSSGQFFEFMLSQSKLLADGALSILKEIAASDKCVVGALNNEARATNEYRFDTFGLREYFQVAFSSCYLGLRKSDRAMYRRALDILGRPPERVLFIDDRQQNMDGAAALGIKTILFEGADALRGRLEELGVL